MYSDTMNYLPDDILTKVDRMAMRSSLETRIPLIDHNIMEFCWSLPRSLIHESNNPKIILKEVLHKYIPKNLITDEEKGFGIPIKDWLKVQLKEWAIDLLNESDQTLYVQFEDGAVGWIKSRYIEIIHTGQEE